MTRAFVALAGGLARGADVLDLLDHLIGECARMLDVGSAGLLADPRGMLHVPAASCERIRELEVFQLQRADPRRQLRQPRRQGLATVTGSWTSDRTNRV